MGATKKDAKQGIAIVYGGVLKQSTLRVEEVPDLDAFDRQAYVHAYGTEVKGSFIVSNNKSHMKDFKKKLEPHHQSENIYTSVNVMDAKKWIKEIAGTEKASSIVFVEKEKKEKKEKKETKKDAKGGKKEAAGKKAPAKKGEKEESGSDSDSESGSESESESDSDSGSGSDSDSASAEKKSTKPAPKGKPAAKKATGKGK